ncbi:solute carrier family 22 member 7-like isoform X1 [Dermacentor albipictus]|uniref:solute carrier family 22 member 7-like isoform X1 n=1 Tax=Dermacentor albipictus TaxID=60249 RepID=UPI0038FD0A65
MSISSVTRSGRSSQAPQEGTPPAGDATQSMEFEKVLEEVGGFGLFNKTVMTLALVIATGNAAMAYFFHVFLLIAPTSQWCFVNGTSLEDFADITVLPQQRCQLVSLSGDGANVTTTDGSAHTCPTGWKFNPDEFFTSVAMEHGWVCAESWRTYTVHTVFWAGSMTSYFVSGFLADRIGRRKTALLLIAVGSIANLLSAFFSDFISYTALRFFAAAGTYPVTTTVFVLVMEYTVAERRTLVAFVWSVAWTAFGALSPWYAYLVQNSRTLIETSVCFSAVLFILTLWLPESSSWLLSVNRREEAYATLQRIARINGKDVSQEKLSKLLNATASDAQTQTVADKAPSFWSGTMVMLTSPNIRKISLLIYVAWFAICICYNGTSVQIGALSLDIYTAYSVALAFELPVNLFCIFSLDVLGRRWPNSMFMLTGGIICLLMWAIRKESETWTLIMVALLTMSFAGAYNITYQVASEVFPTMIRGRAVLLQRMLGDVGSQLGAQIASLAVLDEYSPFLVTGSLALVATVLLFLLPETAGTVVPQTIEDGEGFGKGQGICYCPLFASESQTPEKKPSLSEWTGILSFHKKLPVTQKPAVNKAFEHDLVIATIYNSIR